ncbi:uncharacterized protein LOC119694264 [Plutella xylostella]|uniref:uncharacterized protein LOC119694264 n=1 Tax=Plutella xylostella TaxID=51655 RepID=UPI0020325D81|nr:uncharacterized protein LOC119694264 [Plutella xylostella]
MGSWSTVRLKDELRKRKAKLSGKKAVLVQRLEDYDKLFGPVVTDSEVVFKIKVPEPKSFRDITSNSAIPDLDMADIELFSQLSGRENLKTSLNMYDEYFLMSCRVAFFNADYYITGMVASEMRKHIVYNVTVKAKSHLILETQCECAAGMGPYGQCKHILVVLIGITDMVQHRRIKMKTSITNRLQTFHQPRRLHSGDPVRAEDLKLKSEDKNYKEMAQFDPRPMTEREKQTATDYTSDFKSAIINFCGLNKNDTSIMPIVQLCKPANKKAVFNDHDYLEKSVEQEFMDNLLNLTEEELCAIEDITRKDKKKMERGTSYETT